jgi:hypothetical protein
VDVAGAPLLGGAPMKVPAHIHNWWVRGLELHRRLDDEKLAF